MLKPLPEDAGALDHREVVFDGDILGDGVSRTKRVAASRGPVFAAPFNDGARDLGRRALAQESEVESAQR